MHRGKYTRYEYNADERSRTSTGRSPQAPEACASANSATSAAYGIIRDLSVGVKDFCRKSGPHSQRRDCR